MTCRLSSVVLPFLELSARHSVKVLGCTGRKWDQGCSVGTDLTGAGNCPTRSRRFSGWWFPPYSHVLLSVL